MKLWLSTALLVAASAFAAPPQLTEAGPVVAPVKEPTFFTVKADAGKKLVSAPTYDVKVLSVVRLWTDEPGTYTFQVFPKKAGVYYVPFFQDGEKPLVVEVRTSDAEPMPPEPVPDPARKGVSYRVVFVEETGDAASGRGAMLTDKALAGRVSDKGHSLRVVDKDVRDQFGAVPADLKPIIEDASKKGYPQVYLMDKAGKLPTLQFSAPADAAALLKLLTANGG